MVLFEAKLRVVEPAARRDLVQRRFRTRHDPQPRPAATNPPPRLVRGHRRSRVHHPFNRRVRRCERCRGHIRGTTPAPPVRLVRANMRAVRRGTGRTTGQAGSGGPGRWPWPSGRAEPQPRRAHPMPARGGGPAPADHSPHNIRHAPGTGSRPDRTSTARTPTGHARRQQLYARRSPDMPAATVRRVPDRPDPAATDRTVSRTPSRLAARCLRIRLRVAFRERCRLTLPSPPRLSEQHRQLLDLDSQRLDPHVPFDTQHPCP